MCGFGEYFGTGESALEILKKRLVSGEINQQEFEEKKEKLTQEK